MPGKTYEKKLRKNTKNTTEKTAGLWFARGGQYPDRHYGEGQNHVWYLAIIAIFMGLERAKRWGW